MELTDAQRTAALRDEALAALPQLLGAQVPPSLAAHVARAGRTIADARLRRVTWWPGQSLTVTWDVLLEGRTAHARQSVRESYVVTTLSPLDRAPVVGSGGDQVTLWRVPDDPFLPALATAVDPEHAAPLIAELVTGHEPSRVQPRLRSYRPTRRAVVEVAGAGGTAEATGTAYLKIVRPHRLPALHQRHLDLGALLPAPQLLGVLPDLGVLAMSGMPGVTLRSALEDPAARLPHPDVVAGLPGLLPGPTGSPGGARARTVPSSIEALPQIADLLARLLPTEADRLERLVDLIGPDEVTDRVPAHGDYHPAQVLVEDGRVSGLLDVDTVGLARPADDAATMLGHLAVWSTRSHRPQRMAAYARALQRRWETTLEPHDLRRRVAARILGLATGPFRVQQAHWPAETSGRIALAEAWVGHLGARPN